MDGLTVLDTAVGLMSLVLDGFAICLLVLHHTLDIHPRRRILHRLLPRRLVTRAVRF